MPPTRRTVLGMVAGTLVLAGCVRDDDNGVDNGEDNGEDTDIDDEVDDTDATVRVSSHDEYGDILVGSDGLTLYMFDADEQDGGESACYDECEENWPPLVVEDAPVAGEAVEADLSTFEREDGSMQVAASGWPLYYWVGDEADGDVNGQGVNDVWWVLAPDGTPARDETDSADGDGESDDSDDAPAGGGGY